ncbi:hypothetical protein HPB50_005186 [Hyalomma asiaticum]|uniref:Uncharacterized protein n=1 Tax=Hyalomma asiaticum TaxID=266040 RepID=A0ACB7RYC6_HYAAI|nr:hypothetical protein HPB50_005186 [Hyalomma asiaticum]
MRRREPPSPWSAAPMWFCKVRDMDALHCCLERIRTLFNVRPEIVSVDDVLCCAPEPGLATGYPPPAGRSVRLKLWADTASKPSALKASKVSGPSRTSTPARLPLYALGFSESCCNRPVRTTDCVNVAKKKRSCTRFKDPSESSVAHLHRPSDRFATPRKQVGRSGETPLANRFHLFL